MGVTFFGAYTTVIDVPSGFLRALPEGFSFDEGASFVAQFLTAWYGIFELGGAKQVSQHGERKNALVHSAAGGVGYFAVWLLQRLGYHVIATIGSPAKIGFLVEHFSLDPTCQIIVRNSSSFTEQLAGTGVAGFDLVLDSLYGPYFSPAWNMLRPMGRYVLFGAGNMMTQGDSPGWLQLGWKYVTRPKIDPLDMIASNKSLMGFNLIWLMDRIEVFDTIFEDIRRLVESWQTTLPRPHVGRRFPFSEALEALRYFQTGQSVGKVVLQVTENDAFLSHQNLQ